MNFVMEVGMDTRNVLVVDDSAVMRTLFKQALSRAPSTSVSFASDGAEALVRIGENEPRLVFLDVNMPGMNGLELLAELQASGALSRIRVVMVTTESSPEDVARARSLGATGYIVKPFKPHEIVSMLDRELPLS